MATPSQNQTSASPLVLQSIKLLELFNFDINNMIFIVFAIGAFPLLKVPIWAFTIQAFNLTNMHLNTSKGQNL